MHKAFIQITYDPHQAYNPIPSPMKFIFDQDDTALLKGEIKQMVKSALEEVVAELKATEEPCEVEIWCGTKRAQEILGVRKTKMQTIRDNSPENGIQISRDGRTIRYLVSSLEKYLEMKIIQLPNT